jgi:hypothetical protein
MRSGSCSIRLRSNVVGAGPHGFLTHPATAPWTVPLSRPLNNLDFGTGFTVRCSGQIQHTANARLRIK